MRAVQNGWVPCTALARGLVAVQEQDPRELLLAGHCELESDTEAEAESDDPDLDGLDASDADSRTERCAVSRHQAAFEG